jgi:hypothetical protein
MSSPQRRTLLKALETVGSKDRLAAALDLGVEQLDRYLNGDELPHKLFIEALEIVASGRKPPKK